MSAQQKRLEAAREALHTPISVQEAHRPEAIEIAKQLGWATDEELAESQRQMDEAGCCTHGIDPDCCPMGCDGIE
ncbi:hypothetical protein [Comamonas sp. 17RB]|uniref:hypothetical protein n=1 Tax=Comamonas sp. 17RB TaxID=3047025 RepID=UPI0024B842DE|nr:hypothetical protein [Comamonas sp. 17RB]MDI9853427.1 hypothetical protein [Comamonas sp. 17RB]